MISKWLGGFASKPTAANAETHVSDSVGYTGPGIHVVSATRLPEAAFWSDSLLGVSLRRIDYLVPIRHSIAFENRAGLPSVYNAALSAMAVDEVAVFVHDDVTAYDFHLPHRISEGLRSFDVIGAAGHAAPAADHAGWLLRLAPGADQPVADDETTTDGPSGCVNHLLPTHELLSRFGPAPRRVALLDGLFLAAPVATLRRHGIVFDERFAFHFYDLDFCRTCTGRGLRLGTWPLALGHASTGSFDSPAWKAGLAAYRDKWGMTAPGL